MKDKEKIRPTRCRAHNVIRAIPKNDFKKMSDKILTSSYGLSLNMLKGYHQCRIKNAYKCPNVECPLYEAPKEVEEHGKEEGHHEAQEA